MNTHDPIHGMPEAGLSQDVHACGQPQRDELIGIGGTLYSRVMGAISVGMGQGVGAGGEHALD